jgi:hypothetical protein
MTKQENKLKSMLNYYEVDLKGVKDEKMDKKDLNKFLDKFNQFMDYYILQDIISKIKSKRDDKEKFEDDEEEIDPMLKPKDEQKPPKINVDDEKLFDDDELDSSSFENLNDPIDTDINKFLKWLTLMLYSGDHSVIITEDKTGINIKLVKINKGKK